MKYKIIGHQILRLPDGQVIHPQDGDFESNLPEAQEQFLIRTGHIEKTRRFEPVIKEAVVEEKPKRRYSLKHEEE
jgi:hypothetical protein